MEHRNIGRSGLRVSALGLGCNAFGMRCDAKQSGEIVAAALDAGITFFDTADSYAEGRSEEFLGKALGARRGDAVIATKFGFSMGPGREGASRRYIYRALEDSLRRLGSDWIDLYQLHFPDPLTPVGETISTLEDLKRQGKIRYYGCSNLSATQLTEAVLTARQIGADGFVSTQAEYSLLARRVEQEELPVLRKFGLSLLPYWPLANGLLTGKYSHGQRPADSRLTAPNTAWLTRQSERLLTEETLSRVAALDAFAAGHGRSLLELALGWLAGNGSVASVIAGASSPGQVGANAAALGWRLTAEELEGVGALLK